MPGHLNRSGYGFIVKVWKSTVVRTCAAFKLEKLDSRPAPRLTKREANALTTHQLNFVPRLTRVLCERPNVIFAPFTGCISFSRPSGYAPDALESGGMMPEIRT